MIPEVILGPPDFSYQTSSLLESQKLIKTVETFGFPGKICSTEENLANFRLKTFIEKEFLTFKWSQNNRDTEKPPACLFTVVASENCRH